MYNFPCYEVELKLGYKFNNQDILIRAFTHASASRLNNERLEFFGDSILGFIITERLFKASRDDEGVLTMRKQRYVSDKALTVVVKGLAIDKYLITAKGYTPNTKAIPSLYEAVLAAIYLDGGMDSARAFVDRTIKESGSVINYIGALQEELQAKHLPPPEYICEQVGTPQKPLFECHICLNGRTFYATAESKQAAKQQVAKQAIEAFYTNNK